MPKKSESEDLDIEISFLEGLLRRDPTHVDALKILGDDYTTQQDIGKALEIDIKLSELTPDDPIIFYNIACGYSLINKCEEAALYLEKALDLGYRNFSWISRDPMLKILRKSADYKKVRRKIKSIKSAL